MDRSKWFIKWSIFKNIRFKTSMLRSDLCDYCDAYIVVRGCISSTDNAHRRNKS